jgi:hypothetical protein
MAQELFVSLESTNPDASGESFAAEIVAIDPLAPHQTSYICGGKS